MVLRSGQSILHYRLVDKVGQGGMGEVWCATDTRLDRDVALKFLPDAVTDDTSRLERFAREAKTLASLDHPGIASIHGIEEHDRHRFLVMELVSGQDLSEALENGPLPLTEALEVGVQIARAVEIAHGQGVVHRDLKPANVKRTPDGRIKVLDFGLAKVLGPEVSSGGTDSGMSPTITSAGTAAGVILGTAAYMSPEQARGRAVDKRTDVWSFGVVLYELLTGDNPFRGETVADSVGAILHRDPDLAKLPPGTPTAVRRVLRRCLARKRSQRLHDIADARIELEEAIANPEADGSSAARDTGPPAARPTRAPWVAVGILLPVVALLAWWVGSRSEPTVPEPTRRFELEPDLEVQSVALSPDGSRLAFRVDGKVLVRTMDTLGARELTSMGNQPVFDLFWSPDGRSLGLVRAGGVIQRFDLDGGAPVPLASNELFLQNPVWADDGFIYFILFQGGISRLPATGGAPEEVVPRQQGSIDIHGLDVLPGGRGFVTVPHLQDGEYRRIYLERPGRDREVLYQSDALIGGPRYVASGHILFFRQENPRGLWALPFDLDALAVTGEPFLVVPELTDASFSDRGEMVYTQAALHSGRRQQQIVWSDRTGAIVDRLDKPLYGATAPAPSPDGTRIAVVASGVGRPSTDKPNLWVIDLERQSATKLTETGVVPSPPSWSEDGTRIAVLREFTAPGGMNALIAVPVDGSGEPETIVEADITFVTSLNRDWSRVAYMTGLVGGDHGMAIAQQEIGDPASQTVIVDGPQQDVLPAIHPDGDWIAYASGTFIAMDTFVQPFPDGEGRFKVSVGSGGPPVWSPDGTRLYYTDADEAAQTATVVEVTFDGSGSRPVLGKPRELFTLDADNAWIAVDHEDRIVYLVDVDRSDDEEQVDTTGIVLVQNWLNRFTK